MLHLFHSEITEQYYKHYAFSVLLFLSLSSLLCESPYGSLYFCYIRA